MGNELERYSPEQYETAVREGVESYLEEYRSEVQRIVTTMQEDLETALNVIRQQGRVLEMTDAPNPGLVDGNNLLRKYGMPVQQGSQSVRIYADGVDITEHPDSIEVTADEMELEEGNGSAELEEG